MLPDDIRIFGHSGMVAMAAYAIAKKSGELDPLTAYSYGLFHDIGKLYLSREKRYRHPLLGYNIMMSQGRPDIAVICLTHPFPDKIAKEFISVYCDGDIVESNNIETKLQDIDYNFAIKLIQLCDKISGADRYMTIDQKAELYLQRYGPPPECVLKTYDEFLAVKRFIDSSIGEDVYALLGLK